jgi:hypothetical protein
VEFSLHTFERETYFIFCSISFDLIYQCNVIKFSHTRTKSTAAAEKKVHTMTMAMMMMMMITIIETERENYMKIKEMP